MPKSKKSRLKVLLFILLITVFAFLVTFYKQNVAKKFNQVYLQKAQEIVGLCEGSLNWRRCYGEKLGNFNKNNKFSESLKVLTALEELEPKARDCHLVAHYIASSEVEKDPSKWLNIFNFVDQTTCTNGFVHGALEGRSRFDSNFELTASVIPQICVEIEARTSKRTGIEAKSQVDDACAHVLGHILLAQVGGDINEAVKVCDSVTKEYNKSCLQGVFMENITRDNLIIHADASPLPITEQSAKEVQALCKTQQGLARAACFRELTHIYTTLTKHDPLKVFDLCHQALTEEEGRECYFHAINLMILNDRFTNEKLAVLCTNYLNNDNLAKTCIVRSVSPLLSSSVKFADRAITFCNFIPDNQKQFCFKKIGEKLKKLTSNEERVSLCVNVPEEYKLLCSGN